MDDFSKVKEHKEENITLLCATHHQEKTSKRLPVEIVKKADSEPFNASADHTTPHFWHFAGEMLRFDLGTNVFEMERSFLSDVGGVFHAVMIGGMSMLGFKMTDSRILMLNLLIEDQNGLPILRVEEGELCISTKIIDFSLEGRKMKVMSGNSRLPIEIEKLDNGLRLSSGIFSHAGSEVRVFRDKAILLPANIVMTGGRIRNVKRGLVMR